MLCIGPRVENSGEGTNSVMKLNKSNEKDPCSRQLYCE